jgi:hypothetical protein
MPPDYETQYWDCVTSHWLDLTLLYIKCQLCHFCCLDYFVVRIRDVSWKQWPFYVLNELLLHAGLGFLLKPSQKLILYHMWQQRNNA